MFRNLLNYLRWQTSDSLPVILRGMLDQFRDRRIIDFARQHETIIWEMPQVWREMKPAEFESLLKQFQPADQLLILELGSFHRNGYVRQKAIELLSQIHDGSELRCLLIRQNDWVDNIANAASIAVSNRVVSSYCNAFVQYLPFVLHLNETGRRDNTMALRRILELLASLELKSMLRAIEESQSQAVLRSFFKVCMQHEIAGVAALVRAGLTASDSYIRGSCMQYVAKKFSAAERLEIAVQRVAADSDSVRRVSLMIIIEIGENSAHEHLQRALFDCSAGVRDIAQFYLRKENQNVAEAYRAALQRQPESLIALRGLAETGGSPDAQLFLTYAQHYLPSRRFAALRGLSRLQGEKIDEAIVAMLLDSSPRIVRLATQILCGAARPLHGQHLLELYLTAKDDFSRRAIWILAEHLGKWQCVLWNLRLLDLVEAKQAEEITARLSQWFSPPRSNYVFNKPFSSEIDDLRIAFKRIAGYLPAGVRRTLEVAIG